MLASRNRVQAHLAQLMDVLEGNMEDSDLPLDISTPDIIEATTISSGIAALSITPSVTSPLVVDTFDVNDDLCFEQYDMDDFRKSFALYTLPTLLDLRSLSTPIALAVSPFAFNSLLDSGCTNHITSSYVSKTCSFRIRGGKKKAKKPHAIIDA